LSPVIEQGFEANSGIVFHVGSGSRRADIAQEAKHLYAERVQAGAAGCRNRS
jgi:hypothetical protein